MSMFTIIYLSFAITLLGVSIEKSVMYFQV